MGNSYEFNPLPPDLHTSLWRHDPELGHMVRVEGGTALQDGLLDYYKSQAPLSDANVEKRLETEPYEWPYFKFRRPRHNLGPSRR